MILVKRTMAFCLLCIVAMSVLAAKYKVNVENMLNVRERPVPTASVVGQVYGGDVIDCVPIEGNPEWMAVQMKGKVGYVSAKYLLKQEEQVAVAKESVENSMVNELVRWIQGTDGNGDKSLLYWILAEVLIMWVVCKFIRRIGMDLIPSGFDGRLMRVGSIVWLLITCFTVFSYMRDMGEDALWFLHFAELGFWIALLNFVVFVYVFINLFVFFLVTMEDLSCTFRGHVNVFVGMVGWGIGILAYVIGSLFNAAWLDYILWFEAVMQGIQLIIIVRNLWSNGGVVGILVCGFVYLVGSVALILLAVPLTMIALVILVVIVAVYVVCFGKSASVVSDDNWKECRGRIFSAGGTECIDDYAGNTHRISSDYGDHVITTSGDVWMRAGGSGDEVIKH